MNRPRALLRLLALVSLLAGMRLRLELGRRRGGPLHGATRCASRAARRINRVIGLELRVSGFAPPAGALLIGNHRSYTDILALLACIECTFLAKVQMSRWPLFGAIARRLETVFVDRECKESRRSARQRLGELLDRGRRVVVFPEGTTTRGPGCRPFQPGSFYTAAERGSPVVPVALHYESLEDAWVGDDTLMRHFFDRFGRRSMRLHLAFGPTLRHSDGAALQRQAESWIAEAIERVRRTARGWDAAASKGGIRGKRRFLPGRAPLPAGPQAPGR